MASASSINHNDYLVLSHMNRIWNNVNFQEYSTIIFQFGSLSFQHNRFHSEK